MATDQPAPGTDRDRRAAARLRLAVPARQLADAPLAVRVRGAPVGATVVLQLMARWWTGERLLSTARYEAADGTVDVARDAPLVGYRGRDADGLLRTLAPVGDAAQPDGATMGAWDPPSSARAGLAADHVELHAWVDVPGAPRVRGVTRREACGAAVATAEVSVAGGRATIYHHRQQLPAGPTVIAVPLVGPAPAARAAALLASHGHLVVMPNSSASATHLATVPGSLLVAAEAAIRRLVPQATGCSVVLALDVVPDRRSAEATRSWGDLLDRLRGLRVAPHLPR